MTAPRASVRRGFAAVLALAVMAGAASAAGSGAVNSTPSVAVMPLLPNGVDSASAKVLTDALSDELIRGGKVRVLERGQMDQILKEQGFQRSGACDGSECAVEVGRLLGIERMVVGSVGRIGSAYVLSVRGVDVGTGEVLASARRQQVGALESVLTELLPPLAKEFGARLSGEVSPSSDTLVATDSVAPMAGGPSRKTASHWALWTVGGIAVAGGVTAAILLAGRSSGDGGAASNSTTASPWKASLTW